LQEGEGIMLRYPGGADTRGNEHKASSGRNKGRGGVKTAETSQMYQ